MVDLQVTITGADTHPVDSTEMAFRSAAVLATREAVGLAAPVLLEPVMALEIIVPDEHMGDVLGDLNGRRGRIKEMNAAEAAQVVHAEVPLSELFGYSTNLRSLSKGRASYSMEPHLFEVVPETLKEKILNR